MKDKFYVYLSGPIASISPQAANSWRVYAEERLKLISNGLVLGLNPIRHSDYIKQKQHNMTPDRENDVLKDKQACLVRDRRDVEICDLVLINCIGAPERISMGTCIELGMANISRKPVIAAVDKNDKYDTDLLFSACCDIKYYDLDVAIKNCCNFLLP